MFFNDPATTEIYTLSLHDALPILSRVDAQGITIRILGGSSEHLSSSSPPAVRDIREVQSELDQFASVPGNLLPDQLSSLDRKSTRLNSSHANISYAVFCLKKLRKT